MSDSADNAELASRLPPHGRPEWVARDSGWWLTALGVVLGLLVVLLPQVTGAQSPWWLRGLLAIAAFAFLHFLLRLVYWAGLFSLRWRKGAAYDVLHTNWEAARNELAEARNTIRRYAAAASPYELDRVQVLRDRLYLLIRKKRGPALTPGMHFAVLDTSTFSLMGKFVITEIRTGVYVARDDGYVSPVWIGYIKHTGRTECAPPPGSVAVLIPPEESDDERSNFAGETEAA